MLCSPRLQESRDPPRWLLLACPLALVVLAAAAPGASPSASGVAGWISSGVSSRGCSPPGLQLRAPRLVGLLLVLWRGTGAQPGRARGSLPLPSLCAPEPLSASAAVSCWGLLPVSTSRPCLKMLALGVAAGVGFGDLCMTGLWLPRELPAGLAAGVSVLAPVLGLDSASEVWDSALARRW